MTGCRNSLWRMMLCAGMISCCMACTSSPFGDENIEATDYRTLTGRVTLEDHAAPNDVYVWLGGTGFSARTDSSGNFQLTLPPENTSGSATITGGAFDLYLYLANFKVARAQVFVQNGAFAFAQGDLDANGRLQGLAPLNKLLTIRTLASPTSVSFDYAGPIDILANVQATLDSVTVILPKVVGGILGGIILRNKATGELFVHLPDPGADTRLVARIGGEGRSWRLIINKTRGLIPIGRYEIIPYILVEQEGLPPQLLQSLGSNVLELGPDFLKIPFKRELGEFIITGN
ncbi:MAG: hypothetical protein ACREOO_13970 [bacterium]